LIKLLAVDIIERVEGKPATKDTQSHHRIPQPQHTAPARHLNQLLASIRH